MVGFYDRECKELLTLFHSLPSTLPDNPLSSKLPPQLDTTDIEEEGLWYCLNQAMHAAFGDKAKGLKIEERGYGLEKTYDLIVWCLDELKKTEDHKSAELVKMWIDRLMQAACEAGAQRAKSA